MKIVLCVVLAGAVAAGAAGDAPPSGALPEAVSAVADEVVAMVRANVRPALRAPVVEVRSPNLDDGASRLGDLIAMLVASRLAAAGAGVFDVVTERYAGGAADFLLVGDLFLGAGELTMVFHLLRGAGRTIVAGLERTVAADDRLYALLESSHGYDDWEQPEYADAFEPDDRDNPFVFGVLDMIEERAIYPGGDVDWFVVTARGIGSPKLMTLYTVGATDTYIEVYGPDDPDTLLAENDDGSEDVNAAVSVYIEEGQTVWVAVRGYDEDVTGLYGFFSEIADYVADSREPDDSMEQAGELAVGGGPVSASIMPGRDEDWYAVVLPSRLEPNSVLSVYTTGTLDTYLELYAADGSLILENDDGGEGDNGRIDAYLESGGKYFVRVRHYDGTKSGPYEIEARIIRAYPDQYEPDDSRTTAKPIAVDGRPQIRNFTPADDVDWVTFTLTEARTVVIQTYGDLDTFLALYDRIGNMIADDDDGAGDYNARIERRLQKGDYYVRITQLESDAVFGAEYSVSVSGK